MTTAVNLTRIENGFNPQRLTSRHKAIRERRQGKKADTTTLEENRGVRQNTILEDEVLGSRTTTTARVVTTGVLIDSDLIYGNLLRAAGSSQKSLLLSEPP